MQVTLPQVFFKDFAGKNQLPGFYISGTLVENGLIRKPKRKFYKEATKERAVSNRTFWKIVKPFLANKDYMTNDCTSTEKDGDIIRDEKELVELFNENYINIV